MRYALLITLLWLGLLAAASADPAPIPAPPPPPVVSAPVPRVRDVARIGGYNANPLIGYGVVVGLQGTGDSSAAMSSQMLGKTLEALGVTLPPATQSALKLKNMAVVMLTADLPGFTQPGDIVGVTVSSMGDAQSLAGGILLLSSLRGADGQIYMSAQGPISMPALQEAPPAKPHLTVGEVHTGGLVVRRTTSHVSQSDTLMWVLNRPDFDTAAQVAASINAQFGATVATAKDASTIEVNLSHLAGGTANLVDSVASMGSLALSNLPRLGQVVLDKDSGTVLQGSTILLQSGRITVNGIQLQLDTSTQRVSVGDVVQLLQQMGMTPADQERTLQLLRRASLLSAEVVAR